MIKEKHSSKKNAKKIQLRKYNTRILHLERGLATKSPMLEYIDLGVK